MSYSSKTISEVVTEFLNRTTFLPSIQREFVWDIEAIEKLFDSIMGDYPIGSFLFWKIREENKDQWTAYEFIRNFDEKEPHNVEANLSDIKQDIYLVLDGQQRLTSLYLGLKGIYKYFYYTSKTTKLYLNLLKEPLTDGSEIPEELNYQFQFRESEELIVNEKNQEYWYLVGNILKFEDAEDAKKDIKEKLSVFTEAQKECANTLIGRLHSRIHTSKLLNYYEEKSQKFDKVVEIFIRANTGGKKLEYADILLSTATAKWKSLNAREEIYSFTDEINKIGNGYDFEKDFVLKGCLYLTEGLPIQYKVKNFTNLNLEKIENNWDIIKDNILNAIKLINKFGFSDRNLVSKSALLPISLYLKKLNKKNFVESSRLEDVKNQNIIQKWLIIALLKNAFGGSSDTTLKNLQDVISIEKDVSIFPFENLNKKLNIESSFTDNEIHNLFETKYKTKYSYLILSLLYPERDWKDNSYHEDHIFPKSEFTNSKLKQRKYSEDRIIEFQKYANTLLNLELLTNKENLQKSSNPFDSWLNERDDKFKERHSIPSLNSYSFDEFLLFIEKRKEIIKDKLKTIII